MSEISVVLWWWITTALVAGWLLRASPRMGSAALRWPVALVIVMLVTGACGIVGAAVGVSTRALRWIAGALFVGSLVVFYLRRRSRGEATWLTLNNTESTRISASQGLTYIALAILLMVTATCVWLVLTASAGSSEFFAYNAIARTAAIEGHLHAATVASGERWLAFPTALHAIVATAAGSWVLWAAKLPYAFVWIAALCIAMARLREARVPLAGASLTLALLLLLPSLLTLIGRGSDFAWISACAIASAAAWLHPRRPLLALLFSTAAFVWNPALGWPLALASTLFALIGPLQPRKRNVLSYAAMGVAFVIAMVALQSDTFLPAALSGWFRSTSAAPMWAQLSLWQSAGLVCCALGLFAVATIRSQRARWHCAGTRLLLYSRLSPRCEPCLRR
jgi:hypothetical protein